MRPLSTDTSMVPIGVVDMCEFSVSIETLGFAPVPWITTAFSDELRIRTEFQVCCT